MVVAKPVAVDAFVQQKNSLEKLTVVSEFENVSCVPLRFGLD